MTEPTTLGEFLSQSHCPICATQLRRILYGTDEPCLFHYVLRDEHSNIRRGVCPTCRSTDGHIKTPGLLYRVEDAALDIGWHQAIRREIGEATP
jgi:hypothetical protein